MQTVTPQQHNLYDCLNGKKYLIDFYQRHYVWDKETVTILLKDIFFVFNSCYEQHKQNDLTQETLSNFNWYYLNTYITNNVDGNVFIVDGQQRLTTLSLILVSLFHITDNENHKNVLKNCIAGVDAFSGNIYLIDNDKRKDVMESVFMNREFKKDNQSVTEANIYARYQDIYKYLKGELRDDKKRIEAFTLYVLYRLILVQLNIPQQDTPMIFEVINDRGVGLRPFEILKGKLLGKLSKTETDSYSDLWDQALLFVKEKEDSFFDDYFKSQYITKKNSKVEAEIRNEYHRYIFLDNSIGNDLKFRFSDKEYKSNIKKFISENLQYYTRLYSKILNSSDEFMIYLREAHNISGQNEILLAACTLNDPEEDNKIKLIAQEFDRLYVALRLNGVYDSNSFQEISYFLNGEIKGKNMNTYREIFDGIIKKSIQESRNTTSITSLLDYNVFLKRDYSTMDRRFLRYIFARIEKYVCDNINESMKNDVIYISTKTGNKTGYHIEHILSHNAANRNYFDNEEEFESSRNLLGGLLLLKGVDNISSGNEEYQNKLKTYSSGLIWGHTLCADFYHNNNAIKQFNKKLKDIYGIEITPIEVFDKQALEQRNKLLFSIIKIIWELD